MAEWQEWGREFGTDKATHTYMDCYQKFVGQLTAVELKANILEIGVHHGHSVAFWQHVFPTGHVYGLDYRWDYGLVAGIDDARFTRLTGFQQDPSIAMFFNWESLDMIVDDGGHRRDWQRASVQILWPFLKVGGFYFIEDILTDEFPDEIGWWQEDPDCVHTEANCHDIFGKYERSDAIVVLQKTRERAPHRFAGDPRLDHPRWPEFFRYMESMAAFSGFKDGAYWNWLPDERLWAPLWELYLRN